ncbi:IclR family transcriptional regulator [Jatrophihabitans sp. GAS493]|uniref:IclR family transcriptional regulator n=1 Tax=Jatrophihabitans sp. GAS493 TaxID=1907575 RepID=UPI000BBF8F9C|nr:IclR family transcriptional regulator [Jatrophihabitans sp. GAS493]SOD71529.1 IclR family transcriptional regulator [Jatrophihabitans sp. GAS493]
MTTDSVAKSSTRAVERALGLLAEVCDQGALTLAECARRSGLPSSTALRLLRTLESSDFVSRDHDGTFRAGTRLIQIGASALGRQSLVRLCQPALGRIAEASGESTYLSILGPGETAVYIGMVEGTHAVRHTSWVGRTIPLDATAAGQVLRGELPPSGYVAYRSSVEPDVTALAAPIRRSGGIAGVISVVGPTYRLDEPQVEFIGRLVNREAASLSRQFAAAQLATPELSDSRSEVVAG